MVQLVQLTVVGVAFPLSPTIEDGRNIVLQKVHIWERHIQSAVHSYVQ
jgi:hypothetical protein